MEAPVGVLGIGQNLPEEVASFCERHGLEAALRICLRVIEESFDLDQAPRFEIGWDPDWPQDEWVCVRVTARGGVEEVLAAYHAYGKRWIEAAPFHQRTKVRLSYGIHTDHEPTPLSGTGASSTANGSNAGGLSQRD